jgi:hypothetical protein
MLDIAQLSPPAVAFLKQLVGDLVSSEVCSTFMFLPGPFEISFTAGECDGYIPFKMCIGHRDGNNINVYLPLDLSDSTKTTLVVEEINNAEVCFEWIKGAEFDRIVPFRFLDRNGRSDAEHVANMDAFTSGSILLSARWVRWEWCQGELGQESFHHSYEAYPGE